ncbi:MAG: tetratricopeptide repeat protein [Pseudomonadota bacterium]
MDALKKNRSDWTTADAFLHHHRAPGPIPTTDPEPAVDDGAWGRRFPQLLRGRALTEAMTAQAARGPCTAAALRVIPAADLAIEDPAAVDPAVAAADIIDGLCRQTGGIWGVWPDGTLGCCLPAADPAETARLLEPLSIDLVHQCPGTTLFGGIAAHPLLNYPPAELAANALKALAHAAFFEGGAVIALDAISLNISGDRAFEADDVTTAMAEYQRALELDNANANVLNSLGACYGHVGAYEKGIRFLEAAVAADPMEYMAVYNIGLTRQLMGDRSGAMAQFTAAAALAPEVFEIAFQLGRLLLEAGSPTEALEHLEKAVRLNPGSGSAQKLLGQCHEALDHLEPAIAAYKKAVTQNPNDPETLSALGCLFDKKGENPEITIIFCQQSVDLAPDNGLYRLRLGQLYLKQGMLAEALETFKAADRCGAKEAAALVDEVLERMDQASREMPN